MTEVFKDGDVVRVVRKIYDVATHNSWNPMMDKLVNDGKEYVILDASEPVSRGIKVETDDRIWWFNPDSLELVKQNYIDGVKVTRAEFDRRTAAPVALTVEEIQEKLGMFITIKS